MLFYLEFQINPNSLLMLWDLLTGLKALPDHSPKALCLGILFHPR